MVSQNWYFNPSSRSTSNRLLQPESLHINIKNSPCTISLKKTHIFDEAKKNQVKSLNID